MSQTETHKVVPQQKARAGETSGHIRIVLIVSTILAVIALGIVVVVFSQPGSQPPQKASSIAVESFDAAA
jgi:hypothetical protein